MEIFLVGGAVRDYLLMKMSGLLCKVEQEQRFWQEVEKDWVVVGSTPQKMLSLGFRQVGKSFPVFLHPETQEEYALARTEKKTGKGYTAFECYAEPDVTLEEDLKRRDLTINAIAMRIDPGLTRTLPPLAVTAQIPRHYDIIDYYGGVNDLRNKLLRHVSTAFKEDPVRILRVARFATRFDTFTVDVETNAFMQEMVATGEIDALVPERVWQEWSRSLEEKNPLRFFQVLQACGALTKLFAEKINVDAITMPLDKAAKAHASGLIQFSLQVFPLSKHSLETITKQYRVPNQYRELAFLVHDFYPLFTQLIMDAGSILYFLEKTDALRRRERFMQFLDACLFINSINYNLSRAQLLTTILKDLGEINYAQLLSTEMKDREIAQIIKQIRIETIQKVLNRYRR